jgi:hypothetical protein
MRWWKKTFIGAAGSWANTSNRQLKRGTELMDNDNGKRFHVTLNSYERKALEFVRLQQADRMSRTKTIGVCIRAAAIQLGFNGSLDAAEDVFRRKTDAPL